MAQTTVPVRAADERPRRWEPAQMLAEMEREFERWWSQPWLTPLFQPFGRLITEMASWTPRMDVFEKDNELIVKVDLPGVRREDIQVMLDRGDLVIQGERKEETEVKEENFYRRERIYGRFYRRVPLSFEVKPEQIQATYRDGVLEIRIPKPAQAREEPRKITVA